MLLITLLFQTFKLLYLRYLLFLKWVTNVTVEIKIKAETATTFVNIQYTQ